MTSVLRLPEYLSPTLNQWQRLHYRARAREKKRVMDHIALALINTFDADLRFDGPVQVRYTRVRRSGPTMDDDNLGGSFKAIGDALQEIGVVSNDRDITLQSLQRRVNKDGWYGTILEFTPIDEG